MNKFRAWRLFVPREGRVRIRNPWAKIKIGWTPSDNSNNDIKVVLNDITVKYSI
jgi:hypothetical protein